MNSCDQCWVYNPSIKGGLLFLTALPGASWLCSPIHIQDRWSWGGLTRPLSSVCLSAVLCLCATTLLCRVMFWFMAAPVRWRLLLTNLLLLPWRDDGGLGAPLLPSATATTPRRTVPQSGALPSPAFPTMNPLYVLGVWLLRWSHSQTRVGGWAKSAGRII